MEYHSDWQVPVMTIGSRMRFLATHALKLQ